MFAALAIERDPLRLEDVPDGILYWIQSAGGFAAVGLLLWFVFGLPNWRREDREGVPRWQKALFLGATVLAVLFYLASYVAMLAPSGPRSFPWAGLFLTLAGFCAVFAVGMPFLGNLFSLRWRRIFALAKLSFKEAVRRRVLYVFGFLLLLFMFGNWFYQAKPSDQVRTYVDVVYLAMGLLLLFTAVLVASFSIPADIRQQTIHTIVTKPVERFEIVLGRFLGFFALMSLVLVLMTALSLLYVLRNIPPEAASESLKAREPLYGNVLRFENTDDPEGRKGINVGREWEYRSYITRPLAGQEAQTGCWDFMRLPASLGSRGEVGCEYTFDVYRTTKGDEGRDVACTFRFFTWRFQRGNDAAYRKARNEAMRDPQLTADARRERESELAEQYGYYELNAQQVTDYRTQDFVLPGGLFKNAVAPDPEREDELKTLGLRKIPLTVRVTCDSPTQYVGMARHDFYIRLDSGTGRSEQTAFALNFFKGAFGLWLRLGLVIALCVVLSTYLNGVIALLVVSVLYVGGASRDFVQSVALGQNVGGGPLEAMVRISQRQVASVRMDDSGSIGEQIVSRSDDAFRWLLRRVIDLLPDVDRFELTNYVAEGFNIPWTQMGADFLLFLGYLVPWFVLAFFLMRWREIASTS